MGFECHLPVRMWRESQKAPTWATRLVGRAWRCAKAPGKPPRLAFVLGGDSTRYGGRWFPTEHAIAVCVTGERAFDRAVILHEMAHALIAAFTANRKGYHTRQFNFVVSQLYREFRVPVKISERIDPGVRS